MKQSHKNNDSEVLTENLLDQERMIYENLEELLQLENLNLQASREYQIIIKRLTIHLSKEQKLLAELEKDIEVMEEVSSRLTDYSCNAFNNQDYKEAKIADRIEVFLTAKINLFYKVSSNTGEYEISQELEQAIINQLYRKYLVYLQDKIGQAKDEEQKKSLRRSQFHYAFTVKTIGDELHLVGYNPENLLVLSDEDFAKSLNLSLQQYHEFEQQILSEYAQSLILQIIYKNDDVTVLSEEEQASYEDSFKSLEFFLQNLETTRIQDLIKVIQYNDYEDMIEEEIHTESLQRLSQILGVQLQEKGQEADANENNEPCEPIDYADFDALVSLINIEEQILQIFIEFSHLNPQIDYSQIKSLLAKLEHYFVFENDIANKLVADKSESQLETLYELLQDLLYFRLEKYNDRPRTASLIASRLETVIPDVFGFVQEPAIPLKSYNQIIQNHMLQTIVQFSEFIDSLPNENIKQISKQIMYEEFFAEESLTEDFIASGGQPSMLLLVDNPLSAQLTQNKEVEYAYDKDIVLYGLAEHILEEIQAIPIDVPAEWESKNHLDAYINFKLHQLQNIFDNISDEHYYELLMNFDNIAQEVSETSKDKKKIAQKIKRHLNKASKKFD